ncbi:hypothetical protein ACFFNY_10175 [Paenibacillus hodogayensis]|uniref:Twin-arginine translocation signal domain-containing protein n=1 Tax=Paenibacillus hodogayensis TaxID=279208 RepID=A0ABV5VUD8_9BACL
MSDHFKQEMSRRKLLVTAGLAGVAAVSTGLLSSSFAQNAGVTDEVYSEQNPGDIRVYDNSIQAALDATNCAIMPYDYTLSADIYLKSGQTIRTINGAVVDTAGHTIRTQVVSPVSYWSETAGNPMRRLTTSAAPGATSIQLDNVTDYSCRRQAYYS